MESLNFDAEARALWQRLGVTPGATSDNRYYSNIDPVVKVEGGGTIYVGNQTAALNLAGLQALGVTHVVNCTAGAHAIPCYHTGELSYLTFDIAGWQQHVTHTDASLAAFVAPLFSFIDSALGRGQSVLVHCLAGAHRAGTTGVACIMHYGRVHDVALATAAARRLRPIIDPIGRLPDFLRRLVRVEQASAAQAAAAGSAGSAGGAAGQAGGGSAGGAAGQAGGGSAGSAGGAAVPAGAAAAQAAGSGAAGGSSGGSGDAAAGGK
jgi:predicted protein tyrosine phosphatase